MSCKKCLKERCAYFTDDMSCKRTFLKNATKSFYLQYLTITVQINLNVSIVIVFPLFE